MSIAPEPSEPERLQMPARAVAALQQGNKIEAIRIVRETHGIGLKEAKDFVENYVAGEPGLQASMRRQTVRIGPAQLFRLLAVIALIVVLVLWWKNS